MSDDEIFMDDDEPLMTNAGIQASLDQSWAWLRDNRHNLEVLKEKLQVAETRTTTQEFVLRCLTILWQQMEFEQIKTDEDSYRENYHPEFRLTARQSQVLQIIREEIRLKHRPPTFRELMAELRIKSPNGVLCHVKILEQKGYIRRERNSSRGIQLIEREDL